MRAGLVSKSIPVLAAVVAAVVLGVWMGGRGAVVEAPRLPKTEMAEAGGPTTIPVVDLATPLPVAGPGKSGDPTGAWPWFRGPGMDGKSTETIPLAMQFPATGAPKLWELKVGEGYAGAAIRDGRVYFLDYDEAKQEDTLRCLSIDDGREIWHRGYHVEVAWDHGYSRTVVAISDKYVVALGPKCHVTCVGAETGKFVWGIDLVKEYGASVPAWYAGQCPLVDRGMVVLGVGGELPDKKAANTQPLLIAVNLADGKVKWTTPNPQRWKMTHTCVTPMLLGDRPTYVYGASGGVVGVSAEDGKVLWQYDEWKVPTAAVPSPVPVGNDRVLLTGSYGVGATMLQLKPAGEKWAPSPLWKLKATDFGASQHTPIFHEGFIYGIIQSGEMACVDPAGKVMWKSGGKNKFGLGGFIIAGGTMWIMSDSGVLTVAEASPVGWKPLGSTKVFEHGEEAWGPPALAGGKLIVRDLKRMACLDVRRK